MMMERNIINNDNASLLDLDSSSSDDTCTPANAPRVYENILEGARGRSALAQDSTVIRHYESFASEQGRPSYDNLKNISDKELMDVYGEFATFLVTCYEKTGLPGLQSIMNYMSAFKQSLVRDVFDGKERFFGEGIWYSQIRTTTLKRIVGISIDLGRRLVNSPDEIDEFILNELCRHFLGTDECQQKYGIMIRAFFVDTWNLLGRATEIATSTVGSHGFDSVNGCLMLRIKRSKTATSVRNVETVHSVFAGYREWATCALHAKACYFKVVAKLH